MSNPASLSRRTQRCLVLLALIALAGMFAVGGIGKSPRADAQNSTPANQPFDCGANRNSLALSNAGSGATMYPCVSGVQWRLVAGNYADTASNNYQKVVATIAGASAPGTQSVKFAGGGSASLTHVAFSGLTFCSANGTPVNPCTPPTAANLGDAYDLKLTADSTTANPAPSPASKLTIDPDVQAVIGGSGTWTDLWATPDSRITVRLVDVNTAAGILGALTGNGAGTCDAAGLLTSPAPVRHGGNPGLLGLGGNNNGTCELQLQNFAALNWLVGGSGFQITGMDIKFYYLVTHTGSVTDPYNPSQAPANPGIQLPNTTITVS